MTTADKLHITYLRHLSGVGKHAIVDVILMDFERLPVWVHWVVLGVRWLRKLQDMQPADGQDSNRLAYHVWLSLYQTLICFYQDAVSVGLLVCWICWGSWVFYQPAFLLRHKTGHKY